jgi:carbon-monoxide dehydrogenase medium subunit
MRLPRFEHLAPRTLEEASAMLAEHGAEARAIAGGTDLLVKMKLRAELPRYLVGLGGIPGLDGITYDAEHGLRIGAMATIQAVKNATVVKRHCKILAEAAAAESSVQIRNMATLGGNIANASPGGDAPLALMVAGAGVVLAGTDGRREVSLADYFTAPGKTVMRPGELLVEIRVPPMPPGTGVAYSKHALRHADLAIVSTAVLLVLEGEVCTHIRIGLGAVAPTIMRATEAEALLTGKEITDDLAGEAGTLAARECSPIDDFRSTAKFRRRSITETTRMAVGAAVRDAKSAGF